MKRKEPIVLPVAMALLIATLTTLGIAWLWEHAPR